MRKLMHFKWLYAVVILGLFTLFVSCSSDDDDNTSANKARIEVNGNFSGSILIVYSFSTSNGGESDAVEINKLPWSKEYNFQGQVAMGGAVNSISKGKPGETIELNLIVGGQVKASTKATADANGEFSTPTITHTQN